MITHFFSIIGLYILRLNLRCCCENAVINPIEISSMRKGKQQK